MIFVMVFSVISVSSGFHPGVVFSVMNVSSGFVFFAWQRFDRQTSRRLQ
jgi:hypothetical protein